MFEGTSGLVNLILSVLLFPMHFQGAFIAFAWGAGDPFLIMIGKRILLLLPVFAIIAGCWLSIASSLTVLFRQNRREFVTTLIITWWDLGKSIVSFWGGIINFLFSLSGVDDRNVKNLNTRIMVIGSRNTFSALSIDETGFTINRPFVRTMDSCNNDNLLVPD